MRTRHIVILALVVAALLAAGVAYHIRYGRHTDFMSKFLTMREESRRKAAKTQVETRSEAPGTAVERYVDKAAPQVADFVAAPEFVQAPPDLRRMKLMEFFMLHVADKNYMLLPDAEKKRILDLFLDRYLAS